MPTRQTFDQRYTFKFDLTHEKIEQLQKFAINITEDRKYLIQYLIGKSRESLELVTDLKIPDELKNSKNFNYDDYPLSVNERQFSANHKYDYLVTFKLSTFYTTDNELDQRYNLIKDMIEHDQCQSRLSNIWRQTTGVVLAFDIVYGEKNIFRGLLYTLLKELDEEFDENSFPFYESRSRGRFIFERLKIPSILPLLIYALCNLGTHYILHHLEIDTLMLCMNNYLHLAKTSYQDAKLDTKSAARSWGVEALHNLGSTMVPIWTPDMVICGYYRKETKEFKIVQETFKEKRKLRKEKLSQDMNDFIDKKLKSKSQKEILHAELVTRLATNDSTYYKTATVLSLRKAVEPTIRQKIVEAPKVKETISDGVYTQVYDDDTLESEIVKSLLAYKDKTIDDLADVDLDEEYIDILKMTSAGVKIVNEPGQDRRMTILSKKRLPRASLDSADYRNRDKFIDRLQMLVHAVERQQVDRRQRMIAGINNEMLLGSMASYVILKSLFKYMSAAAQGKQSGSAVDVADMLEYTSFSNALLSSMDVKGMDAAIQPTTRDLIHTFELEIAKRTFHENAGPFKLKMGSVMDENNEIKEDKATISALLQLLIIERENTQTSVTYDDKTFGEIVNAEGTFSSGRADTSAHHTALLPAILRAQETKLSNVMPSTRMLTRAMGDDANIVYSGSEAIMEGNAKSDTQAMNDVGFDIEEELSKNRMVFLQQECVNGCFFGYPDRIAIFTKEHSNEVVSAYQSIQELRALMDDMCWRVRNTRGLKLLMTTLGITCALRITLELDASYAEEIIKLMNKMGIYMHGYVSRANVEEKREKTKLASIYMPLVWLYIEKGGELPAFPLERSDGTLTEEESIHTPRGRMKRKLFYDVSRKVDETTGKVKYDLDRRVLMLNGMNAAYKLISLDIVGNEYTVKRDTFDDRELERLGRNLEGLTNNDRYANSRKHANILRVNKQHMPKQVVFGERLAERIIQTVESIPLNASQRKMFGSSLLQLMKKIMNERIMELKDDVVYKCELVEMDERVGVKHIEFLRHDIELSLNLQLGTESTTALQYLGMIDKMKSILKSEVNATRGIYGVFRFDDPLFKAGYDIWRKRGDLMEHFFEAAGMKQESRNALQRAFAYYSRNATHHYLLSLSPRNMFFIRDDAFYAVENIVGSDESSRLDLTYGIIVAELLRSSYRLSGGKVKLIMDDSLKKHLRSNGDE